MDYVQSHFDLLPSDILKIIFRKVSTVNIFKTSRRNYRYVDTFYDKYVYDLKNKRELPEELKNVTRNVKNIKNVPNVHVTRYFSDLRKIIFGNKFNEIINCSFLQYHNTNLTHLTFGDCFNSPMRRFQFLPPLAHLTFGHSFNQPICNLTFPDSLTHLTFGNSFDQSIDCLRSLDSLKYLAFGDVSSPPKIIKTKYPNNPRGRRMQQQQNRKLNNFADKFMNNFESQ